MRWRGRLLLALGVFGAVGLATGLADLRQLLGFPLARLAELQRYPRPHSVEWMAQLRPLASLLDGLERPLPLLTALRIALLIAAFPLLGALLDPNFRLLKREGENPGKGASAHVDLPRVARMAVAVSLSLWLAGALAPLAGGLAAALPGAWPAALVLGGLPVWTAALPGIAGPVLYSVLLFLVLWWLWSAGGPVSRGPKLPPRALLLWGLLAGLAASPAILALQSARGWITAAAQAYSLAERGAWLNLAAFSVLLPLLAALYLAAHAWLFRPRPLDRAGASRAGLAAGLLLGLCLLAASRAEAALRRLDVGAPGLARLLGIGSPLLHRFAVILAPDGRALYTTTTDGSDDGEGRDRIPCRLSTIQAVQHFLEARRYRTQLAFRSFVHLHDCASLDWHQTFSLEQDLAMLERGTSPVAARLLQEKLSECPVDPENRRILDTLADPARFAWPREMLPWLARAYLRFGDKSRALAALRQASLSEAEIRAGIGAITPLADGVIRGRVTLQGAPRPGVRLGLIRADAWKEMPGFCRPYEWRRICNTTYAGPTGSFEFQRVPEGEYVLILTGGGIGRFGGQAAVSRAPGVIRMDRFHPVRELPAFDVRFVRPVEVPPGIPPGSTA